MVVVTINILVSLRLFVVTHLLVVKSVLSLPDVLVELEVPLKSVMMEKNKPKFINTENFVSIVLVRPGFCNPMNYEMSRTSTKRHGHSCKLFLFKIIVIRKL